MAPAILAAAAGMGDVLDGWQRYAVEALFKTRPDGRLGARTGLVSVARQNGKTTLADAIVYAWLTVQPYGPDEVLITSHDLKVTGEQFDRVCAALAAHDWLVDDGRRRAVTYSFGRQSARLVNGSRLAVQADTAGAGHGHRNVGLVVGDEIWAVNPVAWDHGLLPTQRIHPSPLALMLSTAGDESSVLFKKWRDKGLRLIDAAEPSNFVMLEWSIPPGVDPMDPTWWGWANPTLGYRLTMDTLEAEAEAPDRPAFLRASLNCWIANARSWLDPGVWDRNRRDLPALAGGVLACEVSLDGETFVGVRAAHVDGLDGTVAVETLISEDSEAVFWQRLDHLLTDDPRLRLAITPSLELHLSERWKDRTTIVGYRELGQWTGIVRSLILEGNVVHRGEQLLAEQVNRAVAGKSETGYALQSGRSPGPIDCARCAVWAVALVTIPPSPRRSPAVARPAVVGASPAPR